MTNNKQQMAVDVKELYSNIEDLIIKWNLDGYKTAGYLTRQIMELIGDVTTKEEMTNNKQQTAVEWLLNAIETKNGEEFSSYYSEFIEQAKEMEKEQKANTWDTTATITNITHFCEVFEPAYKPSPTVATIIPCKKCGKSLWQHAKWTNTI